MFSRAQAAGPWSVAACCAANPNCGGSYGDVCYDRSASSDFLFRLQPGEPERFLPKGGTGSDATNYQYINPTFWPVWGGGIDLSMGDGRAPGDGGYCTQGGTYAGSDNEACGGYGNWGSTDLEVWFPKAARGPECGQYRTCGECLPEQSCGWCSPGAWVYKNGTTGTRCADVHDDSE